jgi:hypothetical protein
MDLQIPLFPFRMTRIHLEFVIISHTVAVDVMKAQTFISTEFPLPLYP